MSWRSEVSSTVTRIGENSFGKLSRENRRILKTYMLLTVIKSVATSSNGISVWMLKRKKRFDIFSHVTRLLTDKITLKTLRLHMSVAHLRDSVRKIILSLRACLKIFNVSEVGDLNFYFFLHLS